MKGGIGSRLSVIFSRLILVVIAMAGFVVCWGARHSLVDSSKERLQHTAQTIEVRFQVSLEAMRKDVLYLANSIGEFLLIHPDSLPLAEPEAMAYTRIQQAFPEIESWFAPANEQAQRRDLPRVSQVSMIDHFDLISTRYLLCL